MATTKPKTPMLEWIAAAVGLALILFLFIVLGREALSGEALQPPAVEVVLRNVTPTATGFLVEFEAVNRASGTAAAVEVEGALKDGTTPIETSTTTLDYVAGNGSTKGGLFFTQDPRAHSLELRALGFQLP